MRDTPKILVVDDDHSNLDMLRMLLTSRGYDVVTALNGEAALRAVSENRVDAILLDVVMPGMDGLKVKSKLNEDSITAGIPVIFLTGQDMVADKIRGLGLGADDYVTKPYNSEELLARLDSAIKRRGLYENLAMTDGITGLYNSAFFKKEFSLFFAMAKRYKKPFCLAIIDVDNLKIINDMYGHAAGDFVLKNFASMARATLRNADIVTRYGGDEFAIIMPEVDFAQASVAIERLKKTARDKILTFRDVYGKIAYSVSVGLAAYDDSFTGESAMFELADSRLYEDKRSKADRIR